MDLFEMPGTKIVIAVEELQVDDDEFYIRWAEVVLAKGWDGTWVRRLGLITEDSHFLILDIIRRTVREMGLPSLRGVNAFRSYACGILERVLSGDLDWRTGIYDLSKTPESYKTEEFDTLRFISTSIEWIDEPQTDLMYSNTYDEARTVVMREAEIVVRHKETLLKILQP